MPGQPSGDSAACVHPCHRLAGTTHDVPAYYRGHRCRFLRMSFMANVDGDDIPLVSPRGFKTRCSPCLDAEICDMLCAAICLLLLGSTGSQPVREAVSYRGLFTVGWFDVREKHCFRLEIYDRLRANEQAVYRLMCSFSQIISLRAVR